MDKCNDSLTMVNIREHREKISPRLGQSKKNDKNKHQQLLMQYQTDPLAITEKMTQIMLNSSESEILLPNIASTLGEILQVQGFLIAVIIQEKSILQTAYWSKSTEQAQIYNTQPLLLKHPILTKILEQDQPLEFININPREICQELQLPEPVNNSWSILGVATRFQQQINGLILSIKNHPQKWSDGEKELLTLGANQIAIALTQANLHRKAKITFEYTNLINNLNLLIRTGGEIENILDAAINSVVESLSLSRGMIALLKHTEPPLKNVSMRRFSLAKITIAAEYLAEQNTENKSYKNQQFWASECYLCQQTFTQFPEPLAMADINDYPLLEIDKEKQKKSPLQIDKFPAILILPLENQGTILGFIVLQNNKPRPWLTAELELMHWVSTQISNAIMQNQTLRQVQSIVEERTAQLQRSLEVQAKLYEKTRQQIDQLRHLNQLKDDFIDTISHELRTPLTSMKMAICNLQRQPEPSPEVRSRYLQILEQQCAQEINLIQDLLALQKLESHQAPIQVQHIDLKLMLETLQNQFVNNEKWLDKEVDLTLELPEKTPNLETDQDSLERILLELLNNAGKYSDLHSTVKIVVERAENHPQEIILTISNVGRNIDTEDLEYIFDKFRRGKGVTQQAIQGTGLGLALVKSLVQHINGNITVNCENLENSLSAEITFTLTLPVILTNN
jgi:signal transduction histidine kinase